MKKMFYCLSLLLSLILIACENPLFSDDGWRTIHDSGIVDYRGDVFTFDRKNFYGFPGDDAFDIGFKEDDSVRFELRYSEVFNNTNGSGGISNFSCELISMTTYR